MDAEEIKRARDIIASSQSLVPNDFASRASLEFVIAARTCWSEALDEIERLQAVVLSYPAKVVTESLRQERDRLQEDLTKLDAENDRLKNFIEGIYLNTSTDMPAAWNDEASWYQGQLNGVIGKAARFAKQWRG